MFLVSLFIDLYYIVGWGLKYEIILILSEWTNSYFFLIDSLCLISLYHSKNQVILNVINFNVIKFAMF